MLSNIGIPGLILIVMFALIIFGPKKLPELGRSMGKTLKEFKSATKGLTSDEEPTVPVVPMTVDTNTQTPVSAHAQMASVDGENR